MEWYSMHSFFHLFFHSTSLFEIYLCCCVYIVSFYCRVVLCSMGEPQSVYSPVEGHWVGFQFQTIKKKAVTNIHIPSLYWHIFFPLGKYLSTEAAGGLDTRSAGAHMPSDSPAFGSRAWPTGMDVAWRKATLVPPKAWAQGPLALD